VPDLATIEAATPKCPFVSRPFDRPIQHHPKTPCGKLLRYDVETGDWVCEDHGKVRTTTGLVRSQRPPVADGIAR
jgi:hypothetical protein